MAATLRILGDASSALRAFDAVDRKGRETARNIARAYQGMRSSVTAQMQGLERAVGAEVARGSDAARRTGRARITEEERATKAAEREAAKRARVAEREARQKETAATRAARAAEREQQRQTATTEREARKRSSTEERELARITRAQERETTRWRRLAERSQREREAAAAGRLRNAGQRGERVFGAVASAGSQFAGTAHSQLQDARHRAATTESSITDALANVAIQGGVSTTAAMGSRTGLLRMIRSRTSAQGSIGISEQEYAEAIRTAQEERSGLAGGSPAEIMRNAERIMEAMEMSRLTGGSTEEGVLLRGTLAQSRLSEANQNELERYTYTATGQGSVGARRIVMQALPGLTQSAETARSAALAGGGNAATGERAYVESYRRGVATTQVLAEMGRRPGQVANAMATLNTALQDPERQGDLRDALLNSARTATTREQRERFQGLANHAFERNANGRGYHLRESAQDTVGLMSMAASEGIDPVSFMTSMHQSMGHSQVMQQNWRSLSGAMLAGAQGNRAVDRINTMAGTQDLLSDATLARQRQLLSSTDSAGMARAEATGQQALSDNTSALNRVSNAFADWSARNPVLGAAGGAAAGLGGALIPAVGGAAGRAVLPALTSAGGMAAGGGSLGAAAGTAATAIAGFLGGAAIGTGALRVADTVQSSVNGGRRTGAEGMSVFSGDTWREFAQALGETSVGRFFGGGGSPQQTQAIAAAVRQGMEGATVNATITPAAAAQAASQGRTGGAPAPPPGRQ